MQVLLNAGAEVDLIIRSFGNALHLASYMGSEVIVRLLLERIEDVNTFGGYFGSPLIAALARAHRIIVQILLDRNIDVNCSSSELGYALNYAYAHGSKQLVQSLLDHGANVNAYDDKHGSALAAAASSSEDRLNVRVNTRSFEEQDAIVGLLLRHEPRVIIRECDLLAAASWKYSSHGKHFISLFFRHDPSVVRPRHLLLSLFGMTRSLTANIIRYRCYFSMTVVSGQLQLCSKLQMMPRQ